MRSSGMAGESLKHRPRESSRCIITIRRLATQIKVWQATKETKRPPWTWHVSKPLTDAIEKSAPGAAPDCMITLPAFLLHKLSLLVRNI
jgi:hypothetical protein